MCRIPIPEWLDFSIAIRRRVRKRYYQTRVRPGDEPIDPGLRVGADASRMKDAKKRVLLIYGIYTQGSQAAIEYLTNPERMAETPENNSLIWPPTTRPIPPHFQVLLTTTVENSVPGKSSLVALRIIPTELLLSHQLGMLSLPKP